MRPGSKRIISGICIFIAGAIIVPLCIIVSLVINDSNKVTFKIPGYTQYTIEKPGRYYLWNEYKIIFSGQSYNRSKDIPDGLQVAIHNKQSGTPFAFVGDTSISSNTVASARNSIGYIEAKEPVEITIMVTGGNEERIFSFAQFRVWKIFGLIFGGIGFVIFICLAGGLILVWGIVVMAKSSSGKQDGPSK